MAPWATAQAAKAIKRTSDGKPDLTGLWQANTLAAWDVEDHPAAYGIPAGKGVVVGNSKIPYQEWALAKRTELMKDASNDPQAHCRLPGVPRAVYTPFPWQVIQKPGLVVISYEYPHGIRIIHTDGSRQHPQGRDVLNTWMGDSVGHWDGDALVVDVNGFNEQTWLDQTMEHEIPDPCSKGIRDHGIRMPGGRTGPSALREVNL